MKYLIFSILLISIYPATFAAYRNHQPPTANCQLPTTQVQPPTANRQPSTINHQPFTVISQRSTVIGYPSTANRQPSTELNRSAFYKAMEENNKTLVNAQLDELKSASEELKPAFLGAMLMKRASFIGSAASRLHYFRQGRKMLESAIKQDPDNVEFRFLRLMVQEHAPGGLGYKEDIENDSNYIRKHYKSLPEEIQRTIEDYSKKSKLLKLDVS